MEKALVVASLLLMAGGGVHLPHAADANKGKILFQRVDLGGGTTGKSCNACHLGGKGLSSDLFQRKKFTIMGMNKHNLADVVNVCIERSLGGRRARSSGRRDGRFARLNENRSRGPKGVAVAAVAAEEFAKPPEPDGLASLALVAFTACSGQQCFYLTLTRRNL
jgi:hypothetical protein